MIIAQLCRQPPLHPIWQLIRGCQSCSPESDQTATPDLFCFLLPTLTMATTTTATSAGANKDRTTCMHTYWQRWQRHIHGQAQTKADQPETLHKQGLASANEHQGARSSSTSEVWSTNKDWGARTSVWGWYKWALEEKRYPGGYERAPGVGFLSVPHFLLFPFYITIIL